MKRGEEKQRKRRRRYFGKLEDRKGIKTRQKERKTKKRKTGGD